MRVGFRLFNLNGEANFPAWYNSLLWAVAAAVAWSIADMLWARNAPWAGHWTALAVIFLMLSADEMVSVHETIGDLLERTFIPPRAGYFYYSWTYVGVAAVAAVGLGFARFLLRLPARTRTGLLASGAIFVSGALGIEMIGAAAESGAIRLTFLDGTRLLWLVILEELLEMSGVVLLIFTLLRHHLLDAGPAGSPGRGVSGLAS